MDAEATGARSATLSDPLVDRLLDGRYAIEARLARGGMASVYLATDVRLERRVAVKVMHDALADDPEFVARFNREARAAARLSHPAAVSVYDQGTDGGHVFLVMEYVPGATLRDVLRSRGRLSPAEALAVMDHVLAALGAAHAAGLVHRDIKPENVLVTNDGRVKVADFGLARAIAGANLTTDDSVLLGTAAYLAPEQVRDGVADSRSDVYSAGVMLFELLTGTTPFSGDNAMAVAYRHISDDVPAPSSRAAGIPPELDRLVTAATSRDPDGRPGDGRALHAALVDVRDSLGLHGAVPTPGTDITVQVPRTAAATSVAGGTQRTTALPPLPPGANGSEEPGGRRRRRRWPYVVLALVLLAALGGTGGWYLAVGRYTHAPGLVGLSKSDAVERIQDAGLRWRLGKPMFSDSIEKGAVADQDPAAGARIDKDGVVTLRISRGPSAYSVPDVSGETVKDATKALEAVQLKVADRIREEFSETVDEGLVIRTDPPKGESLHVGSQVMLVVSKGVRPVPLPVVDGMSRDKAEKTLTKAGFVVGTVTEDFSNDVAKGKVIRSDPAGGTRLAPGATVNLVVSKGPELFEVPDVRGKPIEEAISIVEHAGFRADPKPADIPGSGPGHVLQQSPLGMQPRGTVITLYYW